VDHDEVARPGWRGRPYRTAYVGLVIARALVNRVVLTAGLLGADELAVAYLALLPDLVPTISQVAIFAEDEQDSLAVWDRLAGPLRRRSVELCLGTSDRDAVRGADLVLPVGAAGAAALRVSWLAPGAVVVNLSGQEVPPSVRAHADLVLRGTDPNALLRTATSRDPRIRGLILVEVADR
jgi:ornithine cyclodeaminase/alanine dehydrogenase-like protein (mu-crystallin family)